MSSLEEISPDNKWIVALVEDTFPSTEQGGSVPSIVKLQDPATQDPRNYVIVKRENASELVEIQSLPADFSSFFVGRHIVADGNLYILNKMDPLFWVLAHQVPDEQKRSWQPVDQILSSLSADIQNAVVPSQLPHLFETLSNDQTDNVTYYKFSPTKAIRWLQRKQEVVYKCLLRQSKKQLEREQHQQSQEAKAHGGSTSSTFYMPDDPMVTVPSSATLVKECDTNQLKIDSLQVVSGYISKEWSPKLFLACSMTEATVLEEAPKPRQAASVTPVHVKASEPEQAPKKKIEPARTAGNKRLEKVNTKGMKTLGNFFAAPKKKSKIQ
jgi:hypothetical protein